MTIDLHTLRAIFYFFAPPIMSRRKDLSLVEKTHQYAKHAKRFRWVVFGELIVLFALLAFLSAYAYGIPGRTESAFIKRSELAERILAHARQIEELKAEQNRRFKKLDDIDLRLLLQDLTSAKIGQCQAVSKRYFTDQLEDLRKIYYDKTKREWKEPTCAEVTGT